LGEEINVVFLKLPGKSKEVAGDISYRHVQHICSRDSLPCYGLHTSFKRKYWNVNESSDRSTYHQSPYILFWVSLSSVHVLLCLIF
jgi:hypothetical protein